MITALLAAALVQASGPLPEGVFRSRGYGWVVDSRSSPARLYHEAGRACWPAPDTDPADLFAHAAVRSDGAVVATSDLEPLSTQYVFDQLEALPDACASPADDDAAAVRAIADLMTERYPAFEARGVDFAVRRNAFLPRLPPGHDEAVAFGLAEELLAGLDDAHIELSADLDSGPRELAVSQGRTLDAVQSRPGERPERAWLRAWRTGIEQTVLRGRGHVAANNRILWGVRDGIGYLAIVTMGGFDADEPQAAEPLEAALDEAIAAFAGARAVIVDVSNNRGGYDVVSRRIAGRFADRERLAYSKRAWGSGEPYQTITVSPSDRMRYLGPVWLLTSDVTVSAGETFSQMMRVLPHVIHAGTPTRGAFSDQTAVTLPNGWAFAMPMELYIDPDGASLEAEGLRPSVAMDLYPLYDLDQGHARAIDALVARLSQASPDAR